ncbi:multifunctional methyltransferase subunit TRM112-like protein [Mizuhopecten yessoensis]|uniref:multifunctional methyltransferase subunit TRM112-like protein n=1 Tax=Mizuhopecten yessoensis TaxID=6573 RepID=UPI000B45E0A1|nr:multifunctional methyltransferase subunit TRM112-like protein [Mizuhopecten yessoensis]
MLPKIDWPALCQAAQSVGHGEGLPEALTEKYEEDEMLLKKVHHVLMQVEVLEGNLICPETGRQFPISSGIPNMLLNEDEV